MLPPSIGRRQSKLGARVELTFPRHELWKHAYVATDSDGAQQTQIVTLSDAVSSGTCRLGWAGF
jgi:hypothetical protein